MNSQPITIEELEDKIEHLETRQAFQEDTIESLNDIIIQYQKDLDNLQLKLKDLTEHIQQSDNSFTDVQTEEPPPPHY